MGNELSPVDRTNVAPIYRLLMQEVKVRLNIIGEALDGRTGLLGPVVRELCFLQLRMICELIAFACLVAHDEIKEADGLRVKFSADEIIKALERLHSSFYPLPINKTKKDGIWHLSPISDDYLTKADLLELNGKCGDVLHRGTLKKMLAGKIPIQTNFPEVLRWATKIKNLLNQHTTVLLNNNAALYCILSGLENGGDVQVVIAEAVPPPEVA